MQIPTLLFFIRVLFAKSQDKFNELVHWHKISGGKISPKIAIHHVPLLGRGLFAKQTIMKGEVLLKLENEQLINGDYAVEVSHG